MSQMGIHQSFVDSIYCKNPAKMRMPIDAIAKDGAGNIGEHVSHLI